MNLEKITPKIFGGVALLSVLMTPVLAIEATPKAMKLIEEAGARSLKEKAHASWKCYIPTMLSAAIGGASVIALVRKNMRMALAYGVGQTALRLYSERVTPQERSEINTIATTAHDEGSTFLLDPSSAPGDEIVPWRDYISDQEFHASYNQVKWAIERFNNDIFKVEGRGTFNQFCEYLSFTELQPDGDTGNRLVWLYSETLTEIELLLSPGYTKQGIPCWILDFAVPPKYESS